MIGSRHPNRVSVGGFIADVEGVGRTRWTTKVDGWSGSPSIRSTLSDRPQQDGSFDSAGSFGSRVLDVEGVVIEDSDAAALAAAEELASLSPRDLIEFTVDNDTTGPRSCMVRLTVAPNPEWVGSRQFRYALQVTAPDPIKYGPPSFASTKLEGSAGGAGLVFPLTFPLDFGVAPGVTPGSLTVANSGTASYWPRLRIDGPVPNPKVILNETGDFVRVGFTLTAGQWVDIDLGARRVLLNGQSSLARFVTFSGNWLAVPPGGASLSWTADAADPAATLSVWSNEGAWL